MNDRIAGYDLIRSIAILIVFLGHILEKQAASGTVLLAVRSLSPGLTMSLLGFVSAALLSLKEVSPGAFLVRRFTRIYIPLGMCLLAVLCAHAVLGKKILTLHVLLHVMGLSAFFNLFLVENKATIGAGLWFITVIVILYLLLPLLQTLFRHPRGLAHLLALVLACTVLHFLIGVESTWNVVISFSVGVYFGVNGKINQLVNVGTSRAFLGCFVLIGVTALATAGVLPYEVRSLLYALYPLAFIPLLFTIVKWLPNPIVTASSFFAALSYEFYILHFYFINQGFQDFFPIQVGLITQIVISFATTFMLAYAISRAAARVRTVADRYLLAS